jgi:transposase-like protein
VFGYGDVWTWTAICADTKLIPSWLVANRSVDAAIVFINDLASRLKNRIQLTTDGHKAYLTAVLMVSIEKYLFKLTHYQKICQNTIALSSARTGFISKMIIV